MTENYNETFGEYVRTYRQQRGNSLKSMGLLLGVSESYLSEIECDVRPPQPDITDRFLRLAEVSDETAEGLDHLAALDYLRHHGWDVDRLDVMKEIIYVKIHFKLKPNIL